MIGIMLRKKAAKMKATPKETFKNMTMETITPQDHMACVDAIQRFAMLVDAARYDEAAELFAVDGVLQRPNERIEGRAALLSSFKARPVQRLTRHILTNVLLEPAGPGRIRAFSYVSVYRHLGQELCGPSCRWPPGLRRPSRSTAMSCACTTVNGCFGAARCALRSTRPRARLFPARPNLRPDAEGERDV